MTSNNKTILTTYLASLLTLLLFSSTAFSQQYGARAFAVAPVGLQVFALSYEEQNISLDPGGRLFEDANVEIDTVIPSYNRYFAVNGKTAHINIAIADVSIDAATGTTFRLPPLKDLELTADSHGIADPYVHFAVALLGGQAVQGENFETHEAGFTLNLLLGALVPWGDYSDSVALNPGQNRWEYRVGLPMVQQWGLPGKMTTLEFTPVVSIYGDNDDPFGANNLEQDSRTRLELHFSHDVIRGALTLGIDANYIEGGETTIDGIKQGNDQEYHTLGIHASGRLSRQLGWGLVYSRSNSSEEGLDDADWFRAGLNYSF